MNPNGLSVNLNSGNLFGLVRGQGGPPTKLSPNIDVSKILPTSGDPLNYTPTKNPDVVIGKHGATITRQQFEQSNKQEDNTLKFQTFEQYANWVGHWAGPDGKPVDGKVPPIPGQKPIPIPISDKARGLSSNFYPANLQQQGPDVPTVHRTGY